METFSFIAAYVLINIIIYIYLIIKYRYSYFGICKTKKSSYRNILVCLILFSVFAFYEYDTYAYRELFDLMRTGGEKVHVENLYFWLSQKIDSYYLWRLAIWGLAACIYVFTLSKTQIDPAIAGFIMPGLFFYYFSQSRAALGFSIIVLSIYILCNNSTKVSKRIIISLFLIGCSIFTHKSIIVFLLALLLALVIPMKKTFFIVSFLAFPLLYKIASLLPGFLLSSMIFAEDTVTAGNSYLNGEVLTANIYGTIMVIWKLSGVVLAALLALFFILKNRKKSTIPTVIIFLMKYGYILLYFSFLFYGQDMSSFISSRTLHAAMFPLTIPICYYYQNSRRTTLSKITLLIITSYGLFYLLYMFWKQSL